MSAAGASAHHESQRQLAIAAEHERAANEARETASRYGIAAVTEKSVARRISPLGAFGYHLLADRGWPGSKRAQVDLIVVGPSGLYIVDTKAWKDVSIAAGHIYRDQADVTDELDNLADLAYSTEQVMAEIGLAPGEVHSLVVLAGRKGVKATVGTVELVGELDAAAYIASRGQRLTENQVNAVLGLALVHFPVLGAPPPFEIVPPEPVLAVEETKVELPADDELNDAIMASILAAPIEEWMSFLHPDQAKLVRRSFTGPSRIRGAAGTGKTVVGLHRAAYLARSRPGRVLVTTYVRSLPAVLSTLMRQLAPEVSDRVDFVNAHAFALRLLRERGVTCKIDTKAADAAFASAWHRTGAQGGLAKVDSSQRYWRDEIDHVIKGRGITEFEAYADLVRTGRRRQLRIEQRRAVWDLYVDYQANLRAAGVHDFSDSITLASASLQRRPLDRYTAVIVDEAQDLSCSMIRMLHQLVGNEPDGLTLIGDGRQTIYPGGFTLAEAGISLAGRGVVMATNYRNTAEILEVAGSMVDGLDVTDLEGMADAAPEVTRTGSAPVIATFASRKAHDAALVERIQAVTREVGTDLGDVAILVTDRYAIREVQLALGGSGLATCDLDSYDGTPNPAIKIGTIKRAKGLEFKQVLLYNVSAALLAGKKPADAGQLEQHELARRELYVAMTRARDGLWVGTIG